MLYWVAAKGVYGAGVQHPNNTFMSDACVTAGRAIRNSALLQPPNCGKLLMCQDLTGDLSSSPEGTAMQDEHLDVLPNGSHLSFGSYQEESRPLRRVLKQVGEAPSEAACSRYSRTITPCARSPTRSASTPRWLPAHPAQILVFSAGPGSVTLSLCIPKPLHVLAH